jgi:hypothetical protein
MGARGGGGRLAAEQSSRSLNPSATRSPRPRVPSYTAARATRCPTDPAGVSAGFLISSKKQEKIFLITTPRCDTVFAYWFTLMLEISQWSMEALDGG